MPKVLWMLLGLNLYVISMQQPVRVYNQQKTVELKEILDKYISDLGPLANGEISKIESLISAGADPNVVSSDSPYSSYTLLEALLRHKDYYAHHPELFLLLLQKGVDPNQMRNQYNQTPLIKACFEGCFEASVELIKFGADVNHRDSWNQTPLFKAVSSNFSRAEHHLVQLLLENGAASSIEMVSNGYRSELSPLTYVHQADHMGHYPKATEKIRELLESYRKQKLA